jgi:hypothetical protein
VRNGDGSEGPYKQERRLGECGPAATIRLDGISRLTVVVLLVSLSGVPRFVPEEAAAVTNDQAGDETYCCCVVNQ